MPDKPGSQDEDAETPEATPAYDYFQKGLDIEPKEPESDRLEK